MTRPCDHPEQAQRLLFPARDYISGDQFTVRICGVCSLARTNPYPDEAEQARYYPPEYYGDARRYVFLIDYLLSRLQTLRSRQIQAANGGLPGTVLDIGCGRGLLLNQLRKLGWRVMGTELSDGAARFAREVLQLDIKVGDVGRLGLEEGSFDAVVLWHVLEHFEDPTNLLREVARLVRPGGFVLVAVPNFGSIEARLGKAGWFHLDVPRHLSHFTPETLSRMLAAEGFTWERESYFSPEYDYFSVIQSTLNGLGVQQNSLYELLRAGPAKLLRGRNAGRRKRDVMANLVLAPLLGLVAVIWVPTVARMHRGATMAVYARKT
jgi:SAM-dependent methyltransferase